MRRVKCKISTEASPKESHFLYLTDQTDLLVMKKPFDRAFHFFLLIRVECVIDLGNCMNKNLLI